MLIVYTRGSSINSFHIIMIKLKAYIYTYIYIYMRSFDLVVLPYYYGVKVYHNAKQDVSTGL